MKIVVFRHDPLEDLGRLRPALESRGFELECVEMYEPDICIPRIADAAGLVFMGGPMCANDDLPFLRRELELIRNAVQLGIPVLGICLGSQLIAKALGVTVYKSAVPEIGWFEIHLTEAGLSDAVFARIEGPVPVFHWHEDTFELPSGAELLATAPACRNQAFRLGRNVYGLQFHPEMTPEMIEDWQQHGAACGESVKAINPTLHTTALARLCERVVEGWTGTF
jgi:GMP synthase-like glutamine amidotransferase